MKNKSFLFGLVATNIAFAGIAACSASVPIENRPCPCASGWTCCPSQNVCVEEGANCPGNASSDSGSSDAALGNLGDGGDADAPASDGEYVEGTFGGAHVVMQTIRTAHVDAPMDAMPPIGVVQADGDAQTTIYFDFGAAMLGTTSCTGPDEGPPNYGLSYSDEAGGYGADSCSIQLTSLGDVGGWMDGTFTSSLSRRTSDGGTGPGTLQASGSFHVKRRP